MKKAFAILAFILGLHMSQAQAITDPGVTVAASSSASTAAWASPIGVFAGVGLVILIAENFQFPLCGVGGLKCYNNELSDGYGN